MQDVIVGGAVGGACIAALWNGLKKDSVELCDLCKGTGGARCFVCEGSGRREVVQEVDKSPTGRVFGNPHECKPCLGSGLIPCRKCRGSGFLNGL